MPAKTFCFAGRRDGGRPGGDWKAAIGGRETGPRAQPAGWLSHGLQQWRWRRSVRISSPPALARRSPIPLASRVGVGRKAGLRLGRREPGGATPLQGNSRAANMRSWNYGLALDEFTFAALFGHERQDGAIHCRELYFLMHRKSQQIGIGH